jgi:nucleotide-binding universal stress UspA family protein
MNAPILVPLDGSALAEQALPFAEALAQACGSPLLLICATYVASVPGLDVTDEQVRLVNDAEAYLRRVATRLEKRGVAVETYAPYGPPRQAIVREARARQAWLIAMATHGRGGLGRALFGSVADGVVRQAPVPVLLVRAWHAGASRVRLQGAGPILVPLDGSVFAERALPVARSLAAALNTSVVLAQALPPRDTALAPVDMIETDPDKEAADPDCEALLYLEGRAAALAEAGIAVESFVRTGEPADVIAAIGEEQGAALTVLATHGRTGLDRLLMGSVAERIVRHGATPVLIVRSGRGVPLPERLAGIPPAPVSEERE